MKLQPNRKTKEKKKEHNFGYMQARIVWFAYNHRHIQIDRNVDKI